MAYPYLFVPSKSNRPLGIGAEGFARPIQSQAPVDPYQPRYCVQRQLDPQHPAFVKYNQQVLPVGLIGNGAYLSGQLALTALSEFQGASK